MNKNKGIIGIGLMVAIVLGIIVVGGGAYYLGKGSLKEEVKVEENNLQNNLEVSQNQNLSVDNSKTKCDSNSTPSITVLSPNGGEFYKLGDKIIVKWNSCNIPKNSNIFVDIYDGINKNQFQLDKNIDNGTINDGSEEFLIGSEIKTGSYILRMTANSSGVGQVAKDNSDNSFTIGFSTGMLDPKSITKNISTTNWKTYTNFKHGFSFQYPDTWSQWGDESEIVCDLKTGAICLSEVYFIDNASKGIDSPKDKLLVQYHLGSRGSEIYQYALSQYESKQGNYIKNSRKIEVSGETAIVSDNTLTRNGKGNPMSPLRVLIVDFLDKNNIGSFQFQFFTPEENSSTEIPAFEKLLTTFKFN